jgi:hypothetical protein
LAACLPKGRFLKGKSAGEAKKAFPRFLFFPG